MFWENLDTLVEELDLKSNSNDIHAIKKEINKLLDEICPDHSGVDFNSEEEKKEFYRFKCAYDFCENHLKKMEIEKSIGNSGYPFQKEIEKLILSNQCFYYPHQVEVPLSVPPEYASSKFVPPSLDMVLCFAEHPLFYPPKWSIDLLVECKKAYESDWYFFSKLSGSYYKDNRFSISAAIYDAKLFPKPRIKSIFFYCNMSESPIKPPICDNVLEFKSSKNSDRQVLYEACGTLSVALVHFLNNGKQSINYLSKNGCDPDNVSIVFPIIVTTARLHLLDSEKLTVDLTTGKMDKTSINYKEVDWVLFEFPMSPSLQIKADPVHSLYDFASELATKMGCIVVRADKLITFLSEFNVDLLNTIAEKFLKDDDYVVSSTKYKFENI